MKNWFKSTRCWWSSLTKNQNMWFFPLLSNKSNQCCQVWQIFDTIGLLSTTCYFKSKVPTPTKLATVQGKNSSVLLILKFLKCKLMYHSSFAESSSISVWRCFYPKVVKWVSTYFHTFHIIVCFCFVFVFVFSLRGGGRGEQGSK